MCQAAWTGTSHPEILRRAEEGVHREGGITEGGGSSSQCGSMGPATPARGKSAEGPALRVSHRQRWGGTAGARVPRPRGEAPASLRS